MGLPEFGVIDMELSAKRYLADKSSEMIFKCLRADAKHVVLPFLTAITPNFGRGIIIITELI